MNIGSILCPTDFSDASRHAMEHAIAIGRWCGARVIPVHVASGVDDVPPPGDGKVTGTPGIRWLSGPSPAAAIVDFATSANVDLIVMGTHGASGFRHLILGSVTETVLRAAACPVLTVPPRVHAAARLPFKRILCAIDFSGSSLAALQLASNVALESAARLEIVHVVDEPDEHALFVPRPYDVHHHAEIYERHITEHLERVLAPSARQRLNRQFHIARGKADDQILRMASYTDADVIVMGVGRGTDPTFGSTVNYVVRNAERPVVTVRGDLNGRARRDDEAVECCRNEDIARA